MKHTPLLVLPFLLAPCLPASAQDSKPTAPSYTLDYKFQKGQSRSYKISASRKEVEKQKATKVTVLSSETFVSKGDKAGESKVELHGTQVTYQTLRDDKVGFSFDSTKPEKGFGYSYTKKKFEQLKLLGKRTVNIAKTGFIPRIPEKEFKKEMVQFLFATTENLPYDYVLLPKKPVSIGGTWTKTLARKIFKGKRADSEIKTVYTYTLKRVKTKGQELFATIELQTKSSITYLDKRVPAQEEMKSMKGKGTIVFNVTKGGPRSINYFQTVVLTKAGEESTVKYTVSARQVKEKAEEKSEADKKE